MRKLKPLIVVLCVAVIAAGAVLGTYAYLTDQAKAVNTFSVGKVDITLDETDVNTAGVKDGETRVAANLYHLIPGKTYLKDPTVHVAADSEDSWLFVKVENAIAGLEASDNSIADQMTANGWTPVSGTTDTYVYKETVSGGTDVEVFASFTVRGAGVGNDELKAVDAKAITVTAYAIQAAGFTGSDAAWTALIAELA